MVDFLRDGGMMKFPNVVIPGEGPLPYEDVGAALERSTVTWEDLGWIREAWGGPIVIKGVLTAQDAQRSIDAGADAIVVSNHGGRQLDGVAPTLAALPEVVDAVARARRGLSRRRHTPRQRRRQGALSGGARGSRRTRLRLRARRRRRSRRLARDRDPSQRRRSHAAAAGLRRRVRAGSLVRGVLW